MSKVKTLTTILILSLFPFSLIAKKIEVNHFRSEVVSNIKESVLPFWINYSVDPSGGFYGTVYRDGTPDKNAPKGGVLNARILWTFSQAYRLYGGDEYLNMANRAQRYFIDHFIDPIYGGTFWQINADGTPQKGDIKQTYGLAYAVYGLSEHYRATGNSESLQKAIEIYNVLEDKVRDHKLDGYIESFTRDWKTPEKIGYDGDGKATKTMNTHIHVLEAYTSLYRVWKNDALKDRLESLINLLTTKLYDSNRKHLIIYCDNNWNNLADIDSYGHDIETSWLLSEAAEVLGKEKVIEKVNKIAVDMVDVALKEGVSKMGSMMYERNGEHYRKDSSWWCQAESVLGCINAYQITGNEKYLDYAYQFWSFIKKYHVDNKYGEWFRSVSEEGIPNLKEAKISLWNCPYHNGRMGFEVDTRLSNSISSQTEVMAWGNMTGVRVDGELIDFESSLAVGNLNGDIEATGKEKQVRPKYHRENNMQNVITRVRNIEFNERVEDVSAKKVKVDLTYKADTTINEPIYFRIDISSKNYNDAKISISNRIIGIKSSTRELEFKLSKSLKSFVDKRDGGKIIYIELAKGVQRGEKDSVSIEINTNGKIDHEGVVVELDVKNPGNLFAGMGGNFRLQSPDKDQKVIGYCLNNIRVAYGRVEFPWSAWQANENADPIKDAVNGKLSKHLYESIEMARQLKAKGMPVILSCWFPPAWAIDGRPEDYKRVGGIQAYRLDNSKKEKIYKSIADYLSYIKSYYGIEIDMFSFNESDLGIDIIHTPQEHCDFIKEFGEYLAKRALPTKLLLGDNSDATTYDFIVPALNDINALPYIGAVSFHSWRGCDDVTLIKWREAARKLNVPLIVGEGSTDAAAYGYPEIFNESTFALYEINLYTRICALSQPKSILQWQLTSDYSLLLGDGIFRTEGPLRTTQRFWNIKQLASTPEESMHIPAKVNKESVNVAAFANIVRGEYALHLVNNGASREATIKGLPDNVKSVRVYVTNSKESMKESKVNVTDGFVRILLQPISFISIFTE